MQKVGAICVDAAGHVRAGGLRGAAERRGRDGGSEKSADHLSARSKLSALVAPSEWMSAVPK